MSESEVGAGIVNESGIVNKSGSGSGSESDGGYWPKLGLVLQPEGVNSLLFSAQSSELHVYNLHSW